MKLVKLFRAGRMKRGGGGFSFEIRRYLISISVSTERESASLLTGATRGQGISKVVACIQKSK